MTASSFKLLLFLCYIHYLLDLHRRPYLHPQSVFLLFMCPWVAKLYIKVMKCAFLQSSFGVNYKCFDLFIHLRCWFMPESPSLPPQLIPALCISSFFFFQTLVLAAELVTLSSGLQTWLECNQQQETHLEPCVFHTYKSEQQTVPSSSPASTDLCAFGFRVVCPRSTIRTLLTFTDAFHLCVYSLRQYFFYE